MYIRKRSDSGKKLPAEQNKELDEVNMTQQAARNNFQIAQNQSKRYYKKRILQNNSIQSSAKTICFKKNLQISNSQFDNSCQDNKNKSSLTPTFRKQQYNQYQKIGSDARSINSVVSGYIKRNDVCQTNQKYYLSRAKKANKVVKKNSLLSIRNSEKDSDYQCARTQIQDSFLDDTEQNKDIYNLQEQISKLKKTINNLKNKQMKLQQQIAQYSHNKQEIKKLIIENVKLRKDNEIYSKQKQNLTKKLKELSTEILSYQKQKRLYIRQITQLTACRVPYQTQQLQTYKQMSMQQQVKQLKEKLKLNQSQIVKQIQDELNFSRNQYNKLKQQYISLDVAYRGILRKNQGGDKNSSYNNNNKSTSSRDYTILKSKYDKLTTQCKILKKTNMQYERQLAEQRRKCNPKWVKPNKSVEQSKRFINNNNSIDNILKGSHNQDDSIQFNLSVSYDYQ